MPIKVKGGTRRKRSSLKPKTQERIKSAEGTMLLPTAELVLYQSRGEWRVALTVFDRSFKGTTLESVLGGSEIVAVDKAMQIAKRLGLEPKYTSPHKPPGYRSWLRLVPAKEFKS